jgi:serine/threonine-protein kinase
VAERIGLGTEIAGYRVTGLIAQGGMGTVYLAEQEGSDRRVALKVLAPALAGKPEFRERFMRESRYASGLDHPHIVKVREVGESDGLLYLAMDYIHGMDLTTLLALEGPLDPQRALAILSPIAEALDAVHATGLMHRDVKPGNVIVTEDKAGGGGPHSYLTDFGLSKNPAEDARALTAAGDFVGTYHYTAPEQILGSNPDRRVDVYSLGCLLFECLTEEPPFHGMEEAEVLHAHIEGTPPRLSERRSDLPAALDDVIAKALAKRPEDRHATCSELIDEVRAAVGLGPAGDGVRPKTEETLDATLERLRMKVSEGDARGRDIDLDDELVIGRQTAGDGNLAGDPEISRRHARIYRAGRAWAIEDLGSSNGTFVNGLRIGGPQLLNPGDKVQVGTTTLVVEAGPDTPRDDTRAGADEGAGALADAPVTPPPIPLRVEHVPGASEALIELEGEAEPIRLVFDRGRWRFSAGGNA